MGKFSIRHGLTLTAALLAGGAIALPFASNASSAGTATSATATTVTTTTVPTTPTGTTTTTTAPEPLPPLAYNGAVEQITPSSALLKGKVYPRGQATEYYFQYGPTAAYGSQTPPAAAGSGTAEVKVAQPIAGLQPYTTYHFRILATSSAGTATSTDATFTTKKIPLSLLATVTPNPVVFGSPLTVSGTLSGTGNAGVEVVVQANAFPYDRGFHDLTSAKPTSSTGAFSFPLAGFLESAQLRVATVGKAVLYSPTITEPVAVRVTLHVRPARRRGFVRLYGTVTPSQPHAGVAFERRVNDSYVTVGGTTVRAGSIARFVRTIRLRRSGLYRALVVTPGGAQVSGRSRPVLIR
jgi:hypothetical protein